MGREAACACTWGSRRGDVKALLETHEIVVRGSLRAVAPLERIRDVRVEGDALRFSVDGIAVTLELGARTAGSWARKIATPPPTLAAKLGCTVGMRVRLIGDPAAILEGALEGTVRSIRGSYALAIARVETAGHLAALPDVAPLWVIYRKGKGAPVGEPAVREALRARGLVDVKTCAVDGAYTALKFIRRA